MKRNSLFLLVVSAMALALSSCSGYWYNPGGGGGVGTPPPTPTATLSLTLHDAPPANTSIVSFKLAITGVALNPAGGGPAVNLALTPNPYNPYVLELTRLTSDSAFLGSFTVPAGNYSSITLAMAIPSITFANQSGSTVSGCLTGSVCEIMPAAAGNITVSTAPFPLTLSASGQSGLTLDFNLGNVLTATGGNLGVDFTAADVLSASTLPHTGAPSGTLDLLEDFTGKVTAVSSSSITVQSETRGTLTGALNSSTVYYDPLGTCLALDSTCLHTGQTLSVDAALNPAGSFTIRSVDLLDTTSVDEIEGTVILTGPPPSTQFNLVLSDKVVASGNASLSSALTGDIVLVTLSATPTFQVDTDGLTLPPAALSLFQGGTDTSVLFNGQTVMVRVTTAAGSSGAGNLTATVDRVLLRYTRTTATINSTAVPTYFTYDATTLPPYFSILGTAQVQVFPNVTNYDGVSDVTGLASGDIVSVRALYIKSAAPPFFAAKVRKH